MKAVNVDDVLKILHKYGKYIFVTDEKRYSSMVDEIANLKPLPQETVTEFTGYKGLKNWTPISEGLPKEGETVIASTKYGVYPEAKYTKEYGWEWAYEAGMDYWRKLEDVEAWMPLPKRYEPEAEGSGE